MTILKVLFKATVLTLTIFVVADVLGFLAWAMSGQQPADDVYVGTITTHVLRHFLPVAPAQPE